MALFDKEPEDLTQAVHVAVGAASACWENLAGAGVFDSDRARDVAQGLIGYIEANYVPVTVAVDNAIDNPDVLDQLPLDERIRNGL